MENMDVLLTVPEWQGFMECYSAFRTKDTSTCVPHLEDYMECLHHTKEVGILI